MAYETGALDAAISAAAGDDPALARELHANFVSSLTSQIDLLRRARCDGNWQVAARRLHDLGASFHEEALAKLAGEARDGVPGDPAILRQITRYAEKFALRG